jgi:protein TonB
MVNQQEKFLPPKDFNNKEVVFSIFAHLTFFAMFYLQGFFNKNDRLSFKDLEAQSIRVDMVALPDKLQKIEPQPISVKEPESQTQESNKPKESEAKPLEVENSPVFVKKDRIKKEPTKAKQSKALDKLKKLSALDKIKSEIQAESLQKIKNQTVKGNQISKGNSLTGLSRLAAENYSQNIQRLIRSNWALPNYLRNKNLSSIVDLKVDNLGNVTSKEIYRSSGNITFDDLVLTTIERSTPLPKPPDEISQYFFSQGYRIEFKE